MGAALVIQPDGKITDVNLKPGGDPLPLMYEHLGCLAVDVIALTSVLDMRVGVEGQGTRPVNPLATALAPHYGHTRQPCTGPVLVCGSNSAGGSVDLDRSQVDALLTRLADMVKG
jgi:hypothetical protein